MNEKTRVTLRTVCMLSLILVFGLGMTSCAEDECTEMVTAELVGSQLRTGNLELTEDMSFSGDKVFQNVELNGYTLTVTGNLNINGNVEGEGNIFVNGTLVVSGNVEEANLRADLNIIVNGNVEESILRARTGSLSVNGNIEDSSLYYCTTKTINGNVEDTTVNRTCDTLSSGGGVFGSRTQLEVPCGTETFQRNGLTYRVIR
jgi:cytoskeletal protein CcmA (bactofilin family)